MRAKRQQELDSAVQEVSSYLFAESHVAGLWLWVHAGRGQNEGHWKLNKQLSGYV
jgi:hypothetical protein